MHEKTDMTDTSYLELKINKKAKYPLKQLDLQPTTNHNEQLKMYPTFTTWEASIQESKKHITSSLATI